MGPWVSEGTLRWRVRKARRPGDIGAAVGRFAAQLFGRHVGQGPGDLLRTGQARGHREIAFRMRELGQAEIQILRRPSVVRRRLAGFRSRWMMPRAWAAARLCASCKPRRTISFEGSAPQPASCRAILRNVFRDQKVCLVVVIKVVDGGDIRVELGQGERLLAKTLAGASSARVPGGRTFMATSRSSCSSWAERPLPSRPRRSAPRCGSG